MVTAMRLGARVLVASLLIGFAIAISAGQAYACSCALQPLEDRVRSADGVFVGTTDDLVAGLSSTYHVQVTVVYKGKPSAEVTINTGTEDPKPDDGIFVSSSCDTPLRPGRERLFFVAGARDAWTLRACSYPEPPNHAERPDFVTLLGPPAAPVAVPAPSTTQQAGAGDQVSQEPAGSNTWEWLATGGGLLAACVVLLVAILRRRGSSA